MQSRKTIKILWTGGWDSSFRVISLAGKEVTIQPYYVSDNRVSEKKELDAIAEITNELLKSGDTKSIIAPLQIVSSHEIQKDEEISASYHALLKKKFMGSQYDWLARLAKNNEGLELSIHRDDMAFEIIKTFGKVSLINDEAGDYYVVDRNESPKDIVNVFGKFRFPLLELSKIDMKKLAESKGFADLMNKTWFCHHPIDDKPCGFCHPCKYTIEEGMSFRFTIAALRRYKLRFFYNIKSRIFSKATKCVFF